MVASSSPIEASSMVRPFDILVPLLVPSTSAASTEPVARRKSAVPRSYITRMSSSPVRRPMSGSPHTVAAASAMASVQAELIQEAAWPSSPREPPWSAMASTLSTASSPSARRTYERIIFAIEPFTSRLVASRLVRPVLIYQEFDAIGAPPEETPRQMAQTGQKPQLAD